MEQPLTYRWQNADNFYTAMLTPDLFGGWTLVTSSCPRAGRGGRVQQKPLPSYEKGLDAIRRLRHRRHQEGYQLCGTGFAEFQRLDRGSSDLRSAEALALRRLFESWQLTHEEQATLLGVDGRALDGYLEGRPLANDGALLVRVGHLLAINKAMRLRYGERPDFLQEWVRLPNVGLSGRRPLDVMLESREALESLRHHLDREAEKFRACPRGSATRR